MVRQCCCKELWVIWNKRYLGIGYRPVWFWMFLGVKTLLWDGPVQKFVCLAYSKICSWATPVAQRVERVPLKAQSLPGSIHERGPLLHVFPSLSYTFLSILLCNKKDKIQKKMICSCPVIHT